METARSARSAGVDHGKEQSEAPSRCESNFIGKSTVFINSAEQNQRSINHPTKWWWKG
jgi:hypothetical protein